MKGILRFFSTASLVLGVIVLLVVGGPALFTTGEPNWTGIILALAYFGSGLLSFAVLGGIAEALDKLEQIQARQR